MSQTKDPDVQFGPVRSYVWPIYRHELKKFVPMLLMVILICFNYSILRNLKDAIVMTSSGTEVIPFIKTWVLLPMAVLFTVTFARLSDRFSQERVFYIIISFFLSFFALFVFVLNPLQDILHPTVIAQRWKEAYPAFKWFIVLCENWSFTLFYTMAELWSTIVLHVIFWGFANEVTRIFEVRRFYSVFSIGSNFAAGLAGLSVMLLISSSAALGLDDGLVDEVSKETVWQGNLSWLVSLIICSGVITMALFRWMNKNVLTDSSFDELHQIKKNTRTKGKQSLYESFTHLKNSNYLICIAVLVVGYNLSMNLVELVWKDQLRQLYPIKSDLLRVMSQLTICMSVISTITSLFMSHILSRFGWTFTALITPITMLVTSVSFFSFLFFENFLGPIAMTLLGMAPLTIAVYIGFAHNCVSKAAKYSVFDTTKEMAFIPLDHESKLKGKAAIDGIGARLGKSGGSMIHSGLLMIFYTLSDSSPYVAAILFFTICGWIVAAKALGHKFHALAGDDAETRSPPKSISGKNGGVSVDRSKITLETSQEVPAT